MFDVLPDLSWIAIVAATAALAVLGGLYFVALVPRLYVTALGREGQPEPEPSPLTYIGPIASSLVIVLASAVLMAALGVDTLGDALAFGAIVGVGHLLPMTFTIAINPNFPRPVYYTLLNAPYFVVGSLMTAVILEVVS